MTETGEIMIGLIGRKIGMTQMYGENGVLRPSTLIEVGPCPVVQVKSSSGKDGYNAVKLGFLESEKVKKPEKGITEKANVPSMKIMREFRIDYGEEYVFSDDTDLFDINREKGIVSFIPEKEGEFYAVIIALREVDDFQYKLIKFKVVGNEN